MSWKMQVFDRDGTYKTDLTEATSRQIQLHLDGIDQLTFVIPLDSPEATALKMLSTSVKVWRTINIPGGGTYTDPPELPGFAGVVAGMQASGAQNQLQVTVFSPFWKLQFRFARATRRDHNKTTHGYLSDLIDATNSLYVTGGYDGAGRTGIITQGVTTYGWGVYGHVAVNDPFKNFKYQRGTCLWDEIQAKIVQANPNLELHPLYAHLADHKRLVYFNTTNHRGSLPDNPACDLAFHTGPSNCEDMVVTESAQTNQFANYVVLQGQGDGDTMTVVYPKTGDTNGTKRIVHYGIYEMWMQDSKWKYRQSMRDFARAHLTRRGLPSSVYQPTISPALGPWMSTSYPPYTGGSSMPAGQYFELGDNVQVIADYGALRIPDPELVDAGFEIVGRTLITGTSTPPGVRRIHSIQLDMDDFGFERATLSLAPDYTTYNVNLSPL